MINATLGPPPAGAGAGGTSETSAEPAPDSGGGGFSAALRDAASPPRATTTDGARTADTAAGPATGELQNTPAADAGGTTPDTTVTAEQVTAAVVVAMPVSVVVPAVAADAATPTPSVPDAAGAMPVVASPAVTTTAPVPVTNPAVPAPAEGATAAVPAAATPAIVPGAGVADPTAPVAPTTPTGVVDASQATAAATEPDAPRAAATVTLTLGPATPTAAPAGVTDAAPAVPEAGDAAKAVPAAAAGGNTAQADDGSPAPPQPPVAASASPVAADAVDGGVGASVTHGHAPTRGEGPGGLAMPAAPGSGIHAALAREIGARVHVAVREGGREIMLNLRPPELGHLVVRIVTHDGVVQAHIMADRPEAARMLEQAMPHLSDALSERGYTLQGMDVAYHHEAQERSATAKDGRRGPHGLTPDPDDDAAASQVGMHRALAGVGAGRLDLLA